MIISWITRGGHWFSQGINWFFLNGNPDQTISARCYVNRYDKYWGVAYKVLNTVFFWQEDHCKTSFESDKVFAKGLFLQ